MNGTPSEHADPDDGIGMRPLLAPAGAVAAIGPERRDRRIRRVDGVDVATMRSPHGSTRYVASVAGAPVAMLQVVSRDGVDATVANAFTERPHRRRGIARTLLAIARSDFATVVHSEMLSELGRAFARATD